MAARAALASATGMGGTGPGLEGSSGGAGTSARQSPSLRSAGPSTHAASSRGVSILGACSSAVNE
eukprot:1307899-Alexandrium_andersonii.AAC.1